MSVQVPPQQAWSAPHDVLSATGTHVPPEQVWQVGQVIAVPTHVPFWQLSPVVQALPSLQVEPLGRLTCWQE
jgi:hypothetical protein